ncbi:MAG: PQQ-dependent sugar dehydrogenase, partial [Pseudomonadota bacterium]
MPHKFTWAALAMTALLSAIPLREALAQARLQTSAGPLHVEVVADDLIEPWGLAFLPGGGFLVTIRDGTLLHFDASGRRRTVVGTPRVAAVGQGGLLDVLVPRDFTESREVFLSYAKPQGRGQGTALGVGRLDADGGRLEGFRTIFELEAGSRGGRHFGSRIVEGRDGFLYLTVGDRGDRPSAQDLSRENGSVVRIARDGRVPMDNPFVGRANAQPEIWSYGH